MIDHEMMRIHLSAAVPLRMAELAHVDQQTLIDEMDRLWPREQGRREPWIRHADELMFAATELGRESLRQLVTGLAVAALVAEGGITFDGLHFCRDHSTCQSVGWPADATPHVLGTCQPLY